MPTNSYYFISTDGRAVEQKGCLPHQNERQRIIAPPSATYVLDDRAAGGKPHPALGAEHTYGNTLHVCSQIIDTLIIYVLLIS